MKLEVEMTTDRTDSRWTTAAVLAARLIFAAVFAMAVTFKLIDVGATAGYIAAVGLPFPSVLALLAIIFEIALVASFLTGAFFSEMALAAVAYVLFLAFAFHGPSLWQENQTEFGFFVDHFTFIAGLLFAAAHGAGARLAVNYGVTRVLRHRDD
jgi:putative oxidoreductase